MPFHQKWNINEKNVISEEKNFENDVVSYPVGIFDALNQLWNIADRNDVKPETLQKYFDQLGVWISVAEKNKAPFLDSLYFVKAEKRKEKKPVLNHD